MSTHEEHILRILDEAAEPLFTSEIAERLNLQQKPAVAYTTVDVGRLVQSLRKQVVLLPNGRWMLKRLQLTVASAGAESPTRTGSD